MHKGWGPLAKHLSPPDVDHESLMYGISSLFVCLWLPAEFCAHGSKRSQSMSLL